MHAHVRGMRARILAPLRKRANFLTCVERGTTSRTDAKGQNVRRTAVYDKQQLLDRICVTT
jgi:hypothetical protein